MRDKRSKFVALSEARMNRAIRTLRLIGNLANRNNYEYTPEELRKMLSVLEAEMKHLRARFQTYTELPSSTFTLTH